MALENQFKVKIFDSYPGTYLTSLEALRAGISEANKWNADLFISCHANFFNGEANGTEVCCWFEDSKTKKIATEISHSISKFLGVKNRGPKNRIDLYEINGTKMPAIIIELIFIDNPKDCIRYTTSNKMLLAQEVTNVIKKNLT